jgi:hemolysin D
VVQQLAIHTVGEVVTPAQPLLVVVPLDSRLEIEAMIPNREIGFIRTGQKAEIKVAAFNYTQYGLLHGQVINVSRDSIAEQPTAEKADASVSGASGRSTSEQLLYSAHISLDRQRMLINGRYINLRPGMAVTVEIKTGSHRIISYLLSPLARYAHEAMHER